MEYEEIKKKYESEVGKANFALIQAQQKVDVKKALVEELRKEQHYYGGGIWNPNFDREKSMAAYVQLQKEQKELEKATKELYNLVDLGIDYD